MLELVFLSEEFMLEFVHMLQIDCTSIIWLLFKFLIFLQMEIVSLRAEADVLLLIWPAYQIIKPKSWWKDKLFI